MDENILLEVRHLAQQSVVASRILALKSSSQKDAALLAMADALEKNVDAILSANTIDMNNAIEKGISRSLLDRLMLDKKRVSGMANGIRQVVSLSDPVGETEGMWQRPNGLNIGRVRVPMGVVGLIFEARPNVTSDAASLCIKTGNAVIMRGGSEALESNRTIVKAMQDALLSCDFPKEAILLIDHPSREAGVALMRMNGLVDVLIPRGGAGLIQSVVQNASVPVIETGVGVCHVFVDESADLVMATDIAINAKMSRPSVCNAMETLLVHEGCAKQYLPIVLSKLADINCEIRGCLKTQQIYACKAAEEMDWDTEYNDAILSVRVVKDIDEAMEHIACHSTRHSEAIVTSNYANSQRFLKEVDAAAVYINASTRFTDGEEFGFGAEIGISTQKLHVRGPVGLKDLTTTKYIVYGNGQVR